MDRLGGSILLEREGYGGFNSGRRLPESEGRMSLLKFMARIFLVGEALPARQTPLHHQLQSGVINRLRQEILCPGFQRGHRLIQRRIVVNQDDRDSRAKVIDRNEQVGCLESQGREISDYKRGFTQSGDQLQGGLRLDYQITPFR